MTALEGLSILAGTPLHWLLLAVAVLLGLIAGAVPGLGGKLALVFATPFALGLDPMAGAVFLLAMHAVVHTGGSIPSILLGVPGSGPDAAAVVDGHPLARQGKAGLALGASLSASAIGGVIGAAVLALVLPFIEPVLLAFGPAETFMIILVGISFIASMSPNRLVAGLLLGTLGLLLSLVGTDPTTGQERFTLGQVFLLDGLDLIAVVLGVFAVPEVLALLDRRRDGDEAPMLVDFRQTIAGLGEVWKHRFLALRTSVIGVVVGMIPGLGGDAASWLCYGHASQTSATPERFGKGAIEGVIAPETANNSKEGGALIPTLFFGLPGSSGMVILLGALIMLGFEPGPLLLQENGALVWTLIWTLVLANLLAVVLFLVLTGWFLPALRFEGRTIFAPVLCLTLVGATAATGQWQNLLLLLVFGAFGSVLKRAGWSRAPFAIGFIMGKAAELASYQAYQIWGLAMLARPIPLVLLGVLAVTVAFQFRRRRAGTGGEPSRAPEHPLLPLLLLAVFAAFGLEALVRDGGSPMPAGLAVIGVSLAAWLLFRARRSTPAPLVSVSPLAWAAGFVAAGVLLGLVAGCAVAAAIAVRRIGQRGWAVSLLAGGAHAAALWLLFVELLGMPLYAGMLARFVPF